MKRQSLFKIGELSKLYNISVDSIRYYEKMGLLNPVRSQESNYRMYSVEDIRKLTMIRELLNLKFSVEQIRRFDENRSVEVTQIVLEEELQKLNEAIEELERNRMSIQARLGILKQRVNTVKDEVAHLISIEERKCLLVSESNLPDDYVDYYLVKYMNSQQQKVDTIGACDCYTLDLEGSNPESDYLRTKNVFFYSDALSYESNYSLPEGLYISLFYHGPLTKTKLLVPKLFAYAKERELKVIGEPIEFCHIDDYETSNEEEYLTELQLHVTK